MVKRTLFYVIKVAIVLAAAIWVAERPGTVSIVWQGYTVETSFGIALLTVIVLMAVSGLTYWIWRGLKRVPTVLSKSRQGSRRERGLRALTTGFVAVAAGDAEGAKKLSVRAEGLLDDPPLTRLLAAQAAQLAGDEQAAEKYFRAMLAYPETEFLALRGLLTLAMKRGDTVLAYDLADRARGLRNRTPWVLRTCFELEIKLAKWQRAQMTLSQAVRAGVIEEEEGLHYRVALLIERSREAEGEGDRARALELAHEAAKYAPDFHPAAIREARLLGQADRRSKALKVIEKAYRKRPVLLLAELYAELAPSGSDPADQLKWLKKLTDTAPDDPASHLALAEAELTAKDYSAARARLTNLEGTAPSRRLYSLLARIEQQETGDSVAASHWLTKAAEAPPAEGWTCGSCGTTHSQWAAVCGHCGAFDQLTWKTSGGGRGNPVTILPAGPTVDATLDTVAA